MKKTTLFLLLCLAFTLSGFAQNYLETFTEAPQGWVSYKGTVTSEQSRWEHYAEGGYMVVTSGDAATEDWLVTPTAPITATNSKLIFDQTDILAANNNSTLTIRIAEYVDETTQTTHEDFTIVDTQTELEVSNGAQAVFSSHSVDLSAYEGKTVHIAFVWAQTQVVGDALAIDNVNLIDKTLTLPEATTNHTPAFAATDVDIDESNSQSITLSWVPATTGGAASAYIIYFGSSPETLQPITSTTNTSITLADFIYSTEYHWAVRPINALGAMDLDLLLGWTFTTEADPALSTETNALEISSIYPNPVKDIVHIKTQLNIEYISIINSLGQRVLEFHANQILNKSVDLSTLSKGVYFMNVKAENTQKTVKIIKE